MCASKTHWNGTGVHEQHWGRLGPRHVLRKDGVLKRAQEAGRLCINRALQTSCPYTRLSGF